MTTIVTRAGKGSPLTNTEMDTNLTNLNTDKVEGQASSVDSEIAVFSGEGGKTIKRATTTGLLKATSGVIAAASAGTDYVAPSGALGTPSSGTLTNCSGLPASGLVASTSQAVGFGSINLGHASDTTLARVSAGVMSVEGNTVGMLATAQSWTAQQTFKELKDTVHTITDGAAFEIDPANGSIQVVTLGDNRTPAATNFEAGQTVLLGIDDGSAYSITWTTVAPTWLKVGGTGAAPTLATSGFTWILLFKQGTTMFGVPVGSP
jgi:hypothetical protein